MKQRDLKFDYIKGGLIFLVVLGHCPVYIYGIQNPLRYEDLLFKIIHSFHMPLFMLISGWFFSNNVNIGFVQLLKKWSKRLLLPILCYVILGFIIIAVSNSLFNDIIMNDNILSIKKLYHYITFPWYLLCVFMCYFIIYTITKRIKARKHQYICYIIISIVLYVLFDFLPGPIFKNQQLCGMFPFFVLGMYARQHVKFIQAFKHPIIIISLIGLIVYIPYIISAHQPLPTFHINQVLRISTTIMAFYLLSEMYKANVFRNYLIKLGYDSLGIYIIHVFIMRFLNCYAKGLSTNHIYVDYMLCIIVSIIVCEALHYLIVVIRKNSFTKLIFLGES